MMKSNSTNNERVATSHPLTGHHPSQPLRRRRLMSKLTLDKRLPSEEILARGNAHNPGPLHKHYSCSTSSLSSSSVPPATSVSEHARCPRPWLPVWTLYNYRTCYGF